MPHTFIKERRCLLPNIIYLHIKNYAIVKKGENPFSTYRIRISPRHFGNPDFGLFWVPDPSLHIGSDLVMNINIDFKTLTMRINKNNKS